MSTAAKFLQSDMASYPLHNYASTIHHIAIMCQDKLGGERDSVLSNSASGSSGPLYSILLLKIANTLKEKGSSDPLVWVEAFHHGIQCLSQLGGAKEGDRTMLDALYPAARGKLDQRLISASLRRKRSSRQVSSGVCFARRDRSGRGTVTPKSSHL